VHGRASDRLTATQTDLTAARAGLSSTRDALAAAQSAVDDAARQRDEQQAQADHVNDSIQPLASVSSQLQAAQASLEAAQAASADATSDAETLATCLVTLSTARAQLETGPTDAARATLQAGSATGQRAAAVADQSGALYPYDFADPFVLVSAGTWFAYGTNGGAGAVQVLSSTDGRHWQLVGNALPSLPAWAQGGQTWSPSVMVTEGGFVLYYTARERASGKQCISAAISTQPQGPYLDLSSAPLVCQTELGGSIDASPYTAPDGTSYLTWKSEGETVGAKSEIWAQQLAIGGGSFEGDPVVLIRADRSWEAGIVEGPSMISTVTGWTLLYSGNSWSSADYAVGFATCAGPLGPCTKPAQNIALGSDASFAGPGGAEAFVDASGALSVAFAAWDADAVGYPSPRRLHVAKITSISGSNVTIAR
jgi:predicted GH43/DUF377 family glycosyl hydrolase